jgi:hypothetical protein
LENRIDECSFFVVAECEVVAVDRLDRVIDFGFGFEDEVQVAEGLPMDVPFLEPLMSNQVFI